MTANEIIRTLDNGRKDNRLTYLDLEQISGVGHDIFYAWRQGQGMKQIKELIAIAEAVNLEVTLEPKTNWG